MIIITRRMAIIGHLLMTGTLGHIKKYAPLMVEVLLLVVSSSMAVMKVAQSVWFVTWINIRNIIAKKEGHRYGAPFLFGVTETSLLRG